VGPDTCSSAAANGHLEVLKWVRPYRSEDTPWFGSTLGVYIDSLLVVGDQCCPWDSKTCTNAAANGHLEVLKWARTVAVPACDWDVYTCTCAAANGHLEVLKWARTVAVPACELDWNACVEAAESGRHFEVLKWLSDFTRTYRYSGGVKTNRVLEKMYVNAR